VSSSPAPEGRYRHRATRRWTRGGWLALWTVIVVVVVGAGAGAYSIVRAVHHAAPVPSPATGRPPEASTDGAHSTARPTTSTSTSTSTTTVTPAANPVTLSAVGDMELGNTPDLPLDPSTYLQPVVSALAAPIVFGNLEGTLTDSSDSKCAAGSTNCYAFRTPTAYAQILRQAGFTVLNSANNHSHDFGQQGVTDTSAALQAAGITQAGLPGQIGIVTEGSTKVAFVDFAPYSNVNNMLDFAAAKQLISQASAEANVVVVYMHAGAEGSAADHVTGQEETYVGEDRGNPEAFAHAAINDGAALVIASGPHVLRGMEFYHGHLIAYSMGDFASYNDFSTAGDLHLSAILTVTLAADGTYVGAHFTSLTLRGTDQPAIDPSGAAATFVNQLSSDDFSTMAAVIQPNGQITAPAAG
jgi:poly-gamma-glutamate capsule biosynthesis protein CapA/YwtB (metallophosphatase superfamily)